MYIVKNVKKLMILTTIQSNSKSNGEMLKHISKVKPEKSGKSFTGAGKLDKQKKAGLIPG